VYPNSTLMFGTVTGEGCTVVSNSLVLKGDKLAAGTITAGIPSVLKKNQEPEEIEEVAEVKRSRAHRNILIVLFVIVLLAVTAVIAGAVGASMAKHNTSEYEPPAEPLLNPIPPVEVPLKEEIDDADAQKSNFFLRRPTVLRVSDKGDHSPLLRGASSPNHT